MPIGEPSKMGDSGGKNAADTVSMEKKPREDARRNRERILNVAMEVFGKEGLSVKIDEIADRADVGVGTVYRHFPTKEVLFNAVVVGFKQRLIEKAEEMLKNDDPDSAFFNFISWVIKAAVAKKAILAALDSASVNLHRPFTDIPLNLQNSIEKLLKRAQQSGSVRDDILATDVIKITTGLARIIEHNSDDHGLLERTLSIICDGLRSR